MVIFEDLSKKVQGIIKKWVLSKKAFDRAKIINDKCRDVIIKVMCEDKDLTAEKIVFNETKYEIEIKGYPRGDTAWAKAWVEFDKLYFPNIKDNDSLVGEYLRARRTAEINNKKASSMRWEIRPKDGERNETE